MKRNMGGGLGDGGKDDNVRGAESAEKWGEKAPPSKALIAQRERILKGRAGREGVDEKDGEGGDEKSDGGSDKSFPEPYVLASDSDSDSDEEAAAAPVQTAPDGAVVITDDVAVEMPVGRVSVSTASRSGSGASGTRSTTESRESAETDGAQANEAVVPPQEPHQAMPAPAPQPRRNLAQRLADCWNRLFGGGR